MELGLGLSGRLLRANDLFADVHLGGGKHFIVRAD